MPALSRHPRPACGVFVFLSTIAVGSLATAQQFADERMSLRANQRPYDVDRDGLPDLLDLSSTGVLSMQRNLGNLRFAPAQSIAQLPGSPTGVVVPADVDGDGDTDFLLWHGYAIGNTSLRLDLARQQAPNTFVVVPLATVPVTGSNAPIGLVPIDFDGDSDLDLVLSSSAPVGVNHYALRNDGGLVYTETTLARFLGVQVSASSSMVASDVDGDGRTDLLVLDRVLRNTGTQFVNESTLRSPSDPLISVLVGDLDLDGDADLLGTALSGMELWINQNGIYVDATALALPATVPPGSPACLCDIDADGDLDAFVLQAGAAVGGQTLQSAIVLRNDGTGRLLQQVAVAPFPDNHDRATAVDVEGDGDLDIVAQASFSVVVSPLLGDGTGTLRRAFSDPSTGIAADMNGDGRPDLLRATGVELRFPPRQQQLRPWIGGTPQIQSVEQIGDIDADGDLDFCDGRIWRNDGTGNLVLIASASPFGTSTFSLLADLDGDGDLDVARLVAGTVEWAANNGIGQFGPAVALQTGIGTGLSIAAGDADGDGDVDLAVGGLFSTPRILRSQGGGVFSPVLVPASPSAVVRVRWLDLRGNGQVDLVATSGSSTTRVYRVVAATGAIVDVTATMAPVGLPGNSFAVGDVDLDGDTDIVGSALLRHDGVGNYTVEPLGASGVQRLIDIDGDGDLDVTGLGMVFANRERRLSLPIQAHIGRPLRVDIVAAPGRAQGELAVLCLSLAQRVPPVTTPLGQVHLSTLDAFLPVALPNITGLAEIDLPVPNIPAIVGVEVFLQALHIGQAGFVFGEVVSTRIE